MAILTGPFTQFFDADGVPLAFAKVYFTDTNTTDPAIVYKTSELGTIADNEHPYPIICDVKGRMPNVYFSQNDLLRMRVITATGDLASPEIEVDPVTETITVGAGNFIDNAIQEKLGYIPLSTGRAFDDVITDPLIISDNIRMDFTPTELNANDIGFRGNQRTIIAADINLQLIHSQGFIYKDGTTEVDLTIPPESTLNWPIGGYVYLFNGNTNNLLVLRGAGVSLIEAFDNTFANANVTMLPGDYYRLTKIGSDAWLLG